MFLKSLTLGVPNYTTVGVPACSQVVAEILKNIPKPENFDWVAEMDAHNTKKQDYGHMGPCLPSPSVELPQGQGSSRQKFGPWSSQSEPTDLWMQEFFQEAQSKASLQDTSVAISGHSSKPQEMRNRNILESTTDLFCPIKIEKKITSTIT